MCPVNIDPSFFAIPAENQADLYQTTSANNQTLIQTSYDAFIQSGGEPASMQVDTVDHANYQTLIGQLTTTPKQSETLDKSEFSEDDPDDPDEDLLSAIMTMFDDKMTKTPNALFGDGTFDLFGDFFPGDLFVNLFSDDLFGNLFSGDLFPGDLFANLFSGNLFEGLFSGDIFGNLFHDTSTHNADMGQMFT